MKQGVVYLNFNNNLFSSSVSNLNRKYGGILIMSRGGMEWSRVAIPSIEKNLIEEKKI